MGEYFGIRDTDDPLLWDNSSTTSSNTCVTVQNTTFKIFPNENSKRSLYIIPKKKNQSGTNKKYSQIWSKLCHSTKVNVKSPPQSTDIQCRSSPGYNIVPFLKIVCNQNSLQVGMWLPIKTFLANQRQHVGKPGHLTQTFRFLCKI